MQWEKSLEDQNYDKLMDAQLADRQKQYQPWVGKQLSQDEINAFADKAAQSVADSIDNATNGSLADIGNQYAAKQKAIDDKFQLANPDENSPASDHSALDKTIGDLTGELTKLEKAAHDAVGDKSSGLGGFGASLKKFLTGGANSAVAEFHGIVNGMIAQANAMKQQIAAVGPSIEQSQKMFTCAWHVQCRRPSSLWCRRRNGRVDGVLEADGGEHEGDPRATPERRTGLPMTNDYLLTLARTIARKSADRFTWYCRARWVSRPASPASTA